MKPNPEQKQTMMVDEEEPTGVFLAISLSISMVLRPISDINGVAAEKENQLAH